MDGMTTVTCHMSMSLDGFVAGPDQSLDNPLGIGGLALHRWHFDPMHDDDLVWRDKLLAPKGAYLMGRNMFGPIRDEWEGDWRGWWEDNPPYHAPVFVLTHYAREPLEMQGGTTFYFVTEGFDVALKQAREIAGDKEIDVAGGASTVRQALAAGAIDELVVDIGPVVLGSGESMFHGLDNVTLEQVEVAHSPHATHIRYRVGYR
jgi:dihydrofolate reductase